MWAELKVLMRAQGWSGVDETDALWQVRVRVRVRVKVRVRVRVRVSEP